MPESHDGATAADGPELRPGTVAGRFLADYRSLMLEQSPRFADQMRREWRFCREHPSIWLGGIAWYAILDGLLVGVFQWEPADANGLVLGASLLVLLLFRAWRLRVQRPGSEPANRPS